MEKNQRQYKRELFNWKTELRALDSKERVLCATYDLSEGGVRIVSNIELKSNKYTIYLGKYKVPARVVYKEKRPASFAEGDIFYYGMQFLKPISKEVKKKLIVIAEKER